VEDEPVNTKKLYRSKTDKMLGGVCAGLGIYLGADPLIVRIIFVTLALVNGIGLVAYLLLWLLVPEAEAEYPSQEEMVKHNTQEMGQRLRSLAQQAGERISGKSASPWGEQTQSQTLVIGLVILGLGLLMLLNNIGALRWLRFGTMWPILLIVAGIVLLVNTLHNRH
jgi:phage shock protein C